MQWYFLCLGLAFGYVSAADGDVKQGKQCFVPGIFVLNETSFKVVIHAERRIKYPSDMQREQSFYTRAESHREIVQPGEQKFFRVHRPDIFIEHMSPRLKYNDMNVGVKIILHIESLDKNSKIKSKLLINKKDCLDHNEVVIRPPQSCASKSQDDTVEKT